MDAIPDSMWSIILPQGAYLKEMMIYGGYDTKSAVSKLKGLVLEKVRSKDPYVLKAREHFFIQKFDTFRHGLNQEK